MAEDAPRPPNHALLVACNALAGEPRATVLGAWSRSGPSGWMLPVRLTVDRTSTHVPAASDWYACVYDSYPLGQIEILPAKIGGIEVTFPHQTRNDPGPPDVPWRLGKLCLDSPVKTLALGGLGDEPLGDAEMRLLWHVRRALAWLEAAAEGRLMPPGVPFELPMLPSEIDVRVVHDEGADSFGRWLDVTDQIGVVVLQDVPPAKNTFAVAEFKTLSGGSIRQKKWRSASAPTKQNELRKGIWWRWPGIIVSEPWRTPGTWGELRTMGERLGVDVDVVLQKIARQVRGRRTHFLLLGFSIPKLIGGADAEMYWQAVFLPALDADKPAKGFRKNEAGFWRRDRNGVFANEQPIKYLSTENWHPDRLQARGRFDEIMTSEALTLVGCGALGSAVAELLVRGGVRQLRLIDHDKLAAGNLVRHLLTMADLGENKATALAQRLRTASVNAEVVGLPRALPNDRLAVEALLSEDRLVFDATASNEVLYSLAQCWWPVPKLFVSASLGYRARRLFVFVVGGHSFPKDDFFALVRPWLDQEKVDWSAAGETIEGAGCWSPLFPARFDDVMLGAVATAKVIAESVVTWPRSVPPKARQI